MYCKLVIIFQLYKKPFSFSDDVVSFFFFLSRNRITFSHGPDDLITVGLLPRKNSDAATEFKYIYIYNYTALSSAYYLVLEISTYLFR